MSSYALGLGLAALVLRRMELRNLVSNVTYLILMAVTGPEVPTTFWPQPESGRRDGSIEFG